jgi:hypothetical protein
VEYTQVELKGSALGWHHFPSIPREDGAKLGMKVGIKEILLQQELNTMQWRSHVFLSFLLKFRSGHNITRPK